MAAGTEVVEAVSDEERLADLLRMLSVLPQRQDSVSDQLHDLQAVAAALGMYDAADWLRERRPRSAPPQTIRHGRDCSVDCHPF